jgi:hypothetical protein
VPDFEISGFGAAFLVGIILAVMAGRRRQGLLREESGA